MSEASFASLNPALLARKGGAKPAMRPQLAPLPQDADEMAKLDAEKLEDLGWNDMGLDDGEAESPQPNAEILSIHPQPDDAFEQTQSDPIVRRQQKELSDRVLANAAMPASNEDEVDAIVRKAKAKRKGMSPKSSAKSGKRAAFTLRLDADRHLKLRLAATMQAKSAQALVTEALDALLEQYEDLDALVERMKQN